MARDSWPGGWFRPVVKVVEAYRTKRGEPVGEATLACGHTMLVDMDVLVRMKRRNVRRACWTCKCEGRVAWRVSGGGAGGGDTGGGTTP